MKNRRTVIISFLLIAVLVMGIAYANLTDNLFIKGEATLNTTSAQVDFDADVYFSAAAVVSSDGTNKVETGDKTNIDEAVVGTADKDSATFYVRTLGKAGESVTFSFTIKNDSTEFDASVALDTGYPQTTDSTNFTITYSIENTGVVNEGPIVCKKGETAVVYVTVKLNNTPSENMTAAFNVNLTATSQNTTVTP